MKRQSGGDAASENRQTYDIIGAALEVHKELGCGFLERVYREPFAIELAARGIPFEREKKYRVAYKGKRLAATYVVDFVCYGQILVEIKALPTIGPLEHAQVINYQRVSGLRRALLLNFGARSLQFRRILCGPHLIGHRQRIRVLADPIPALSPVNTGNETDDDRSMTEEE